MTDDALTSWDGTVRLFPLPNLVLFPQVVQGLHIFELRYRQMMHDALAGDHRIGMVLLRPDWEHDYDAKPAIHRVACLGRITNYERLPDGRFNLHLKGIARVKLLQELPTERLYRVAQAEPILDALPESLGRLTELRHQLAAVVLPRFPADGPAQKQLRELFHGDTPLGHLCDLLGYALPLPLELKQQLLEEPDVQARAEAIRAALQVRKAADDRPFPPRFSPN